MNEVVRYQKVLWRNAPAGEPCVLYSEVRGDGVETRKVDEYPDGHLDFAGPSGSTGSTMLSIEAMPSVEEIAAQPEFIPAVITEEEFEAVWRRAVATTRN